jgi:histidine triad (HIT) family protein
MESCIICQLIKEAIDVTKVYEDEHVTAIMDINPVNRGHLFITPKKHVKYVYQLDDELCGHLFNVARKLSRAVRCSELRCDDIMFILYDGENAGQEIPHTHLHIIPRFKGDNVGVRRPLTHEKLSREELIKTADLIKSKL